MRVLILAAGFGTRLQELGVQTPKGLISSHQGPLIEDVIRDALLISKDILIVTNERFFSTYQSWLENSPYASSVKLLSDGAKTPEERLGAIGDILYGVTATSWWDDDLLVCPSDTYYQFSLQEFVEFARRKNSFCTVVRDMHDPALIANRLGCAVVQDDQITSFSEKPEKPLSTYAAIPFYMYPQSALSMLPTYKKTGKSLDAPGSIIPWFLDQDIPVYAFITSEQTIDVGTPQDIDAVQLM